MSEVFPRNIHISVQFEVLAVSVEPRCRILESHFMWLLFLFLESLTKVGTKSVLIQLYTISLSLYLYISVCVFDSLPLSFTNFVIIWSIWTFPVQHVGVKVTDITQVMINENLSLCKLCNAVTNNEGWGYLIFTNLQIGKNWQISGSKTILTGEQ